MGRSSKIILFTLLAVGLVAGGFWKWRASIPPAPVNVSPFETDMTVGLLRGILGELGPSAPPVCFLAFGEARTPPSGGFMSRFGRTRPQLRSFGSAVAPPINRFFEISNGRPGLVISVISFREITTSLFEFEVVFSNLPAGQDRYLYKVMNQGGDWVVVSRKQK